METYVTSIVTTAPVDCEYFTCYVNACCLTFRPRYDAIMAPVYSRTETIVLKKCVVPPQGVAGMKWQASLGSVFIYD